MIKKWFTVVNWQQGVAQVHCDMPDGCISCCVSQSCCVNIFSKLAPSTQLYLEITSPFPLVLGQRVEVGINETSLVRFAFLVYILPLLGFISSVMISQIILGNDLVSVCGGMVGCIIGFFYARYSTHCKFEIHTNRPVILQVAPPPL